MINRIVMQGRFTKKPEIETKGGFPYCEFTIAWSEKVKENEKKCFLRCKAWRNQAEHIEKYFDKGQECVIEGQMLTEEWEKEGQKQSRTVCNIDRIHFCGSKAAGTSSNDDFMAIPDTKADDFPFK